MASLDKSLFTNYTYHPPDEEDYPLPNFQISLPALLETLQIFGAADAAARTTHNPDPYRSNLRNYRPDAFSAQTLGMPGTCVLTYPSEGDPFSVILEEAGVKTTCNLTTYLPEAPEEIPFDRDGIAFKVIMQARWLLDALAEMAPTSPKHLTIAATRAAPHLRLSGHGDLGTSTVDFRRGKELLETFSVKDSEGGGRWVQSFKFDLIRSATEAMRIASKVSLRGDRQGVLSLQFMVEGEGGSGGGPHWLHFTFVPFVSDADDGDEDDDDEEAENDDDGEENDGV